MWSTEMTQPRRQDTPHKERLSLFPSTQFHGHQVPLASRGTCILDVHTHTKKERKEKKYKIKNKSKKKTKISLSLCPHVNFVSSLYIGGRLPGIKCA